MLRSLFSGVTGLRTHQTKMDVIGNNISNVNTVGFKSSSVTFTDVFYQTSRSASGANSETGTAGRNPMQVGLGSNVASITTSVGVSGASQRTDYPFDLMIEGDAFFIVNTGGINYFTRAGAFGIDGYGNLAAPSGALVMGWEPDPDNPGKVIMSDVKPLKVRSPELEFSAPAATEAAYLSGNIDNQDKQLANTGRAVNVPFYDNLGYSYTLQLNVKQVAGTDNKYTVTVTDIKGGNKDSVLVAKDPANPGKFIKPTPPPFSTFKFGGMDLGGYTVDADTGEITFPTASAPELEFNKLEGSLKTIANSGVTGVTGDIKEFDFEIVSDPAASSPFKKINIDFSKITMYAASGSTSLEGQKGTIDGTKAGKKAGKMIGHSIDPTGEIHGHYDNGDKRLLGKIATAVFSNPAGLEAIGNNMFAETLNSGEFDGIGQDITQGGGSFATGFLEMSNVDLSAEFTQMITTQRGFQANSRIITTSDTLLEELINLKR